MPTEIPLLHHEGGYIPMDKWGKEHWGLLLYVETRVVDHGGKLDPNHLRFDGKRYPTKLKHGSLVDHNDYDCLHDLEGEWLLINKGTGVNPVCELYEKGWVLAHRLRRHRALGLPISAFSPVIEIG